MEYPGGKNCEAVWKRIVNQIPPHNLYVEPFLGSGAVLRHKRPAERSIGIDADPGAIASLIEVVPRSLGPGTELELHCCNGIEWLQEHGPELTATAFVYCDPPYIPETRRLPDRPIYRCEMSMGVHGLLLKVLVGLRCMVMISGYESPLYARGLAKWRRIEFAVMTRGGPAQEVLWMNYPQPTALHDYRYVGDDFRKRWNFRRQQRRWSAKLKAMDCLRRQALLAAIAEAGFACGIAGNGDGRSTHAETGEPGRKKISCKGAKARKARS